MERKIFQLKTNPCPGVKFRRQHWLFLLICLLMFIIVLSIYLPIASRASSLEDPDYRMRVISQLLRETPLIDGWVETDYGSLKTSLLLLPGTTTCLGTSDSLSTTRSRRSTSVLTSARLTVSLGIVPPFKTTFRSPLGPLQSGPTLTYPDWSREKLELSCGWPTPPVGPSTRTRCRSPWSRST